MTEPKDLLQEAKRRRIFIANSDGKRLIELSLLWAALITLVAPQLAVLALILALLDLISIGSEEVPDSP
jgi:hypothetical protein